MFDVIVIGTGISGSFVARELAKYKLDVLVLEKNNDVSNETTMANSAIVHSGYDPVPGTNKAKFNVLGNAMYEEVCKELDCSYKRTGSLTVAVDDDQVKTLYELEKRSAINQVPVKILSREEALEREPNLSDQTKAALYAESAAIVYPWELAIALMENAMDNGVQLKLNHEVVDIAKEGSTFHVKTNNEVFQAKAIINCAGVFADRIHNMIAEKSFEITPRRGQYFVLDKTVGSHVSHVIFPCPSEKGKGVLVTPTTHGNLLIGPTSEVIEDKNGIQTTMSGLSYVKEHADSTVKNIPYHKVIRSFAGLRPSSDLHDFIIEEAADVAGFIDVAGIESPGLASAPAIAKEVVQILSSRIELKEKDNFNPRRYGYTTFAKLSLDEKKALIEKDPKYGQIICRCETVTEGEIVDCIRRNAGATTIKGVKKRVRPGMGRCQGGFCEPLVLEILARELGKDPMEIDYDSIGSNILIEETKISQEELEALKSREA